MNTYRKCSIYNIITPGLVIFFLVIIGGAGAMQYGMDGQGEDYTKELKSAGKSFSFKRIATLANYRNIGDVAGETVSEIVSATKDGMTLVYTDSPRGAVGFVDIREPSKPVPNGTILVGGEPTSVSVLGNAFALVGVNTSESFTNTSGKLSVISIEHRTIVTEFSLDGQPDSVAISPDGSYAAIVIENERDEEICSGGTNSGARVPEDGPVETGDITEEECTAGGGIVGGLPQTPFGNPPGELVIVDIKGTSPETWTLRTVALTGLATYAPEDPEPEFVDINANNEAVVTLQENNHAVIVDLPSGQVISDFGLGAVTLNLIDAVEDDMISLTDTLTDVPREPDAVSWVPSPYGDLIATANEGDLFGGSRGFSIFDKNGSLVYDSGNTFEYLAVQYGHYPEGRSENKGSEPEAIEFGRYQEGDFLFVGSERGSFIAVYRMGFFDRPNFVQLLPAPLAPEGVLAIPGRNLLVASGEGDEPEYGVRSSIMIYELQQAEPGYPQIVSAEDNSGAPIAWSALSGMAAVPGRNDTILGVWDSFYSESRIFNIDVSGEPAKITDSLAISGGTGDYDPEGIDIAPDGTIWIASEGDDPGKRANRLLQLDMSGNVIAEIGLPGEIERCRAASENTPNLDNGFEGVAVLPFGENQYLLLVAQQLPWDYTTPECEDLDDESDFTRVWIYDPAAKTWSHFAYELTPPPENAKWVGLSEITRTPDGNYILIERDNRTGDFAGLKTLVKIDVVSALDGVVEQAEKTVYDLTPGLAGSNGWITDKPEGVAVTQNGQLFLCTDNDGVDDWSGETWFMNLGNYEGLFNE